AAYTYIKEENDDDDNGDGDGDGDEQSKQDAKKMLLEHACNTKYFNLYSIKKLRLSPSLLIFFALSLSLSLSLSLFLSLSLSLSLSLACFLDYSNLSTEFNLLCSSESKP